MDNFSNNTDINKDTNKKNDNDINNMADNTATPDDSNRIRPDINKNRFRSNSRYFTIMIYCLAFVFFSILIFKFIGNINTTLGFIANAINIISPFIVGAFIAFVLYPVVRFFYRNIFIGRLNIKSQKIAKILSVLCTYILVLGIITILLVFIVPQIYSSLSEITVRLPVWYKNAIEFVKSLEQKYPNVAFLDYDYINEKMESALPLITNYITGMMSSLLPVIFTTSMAIVKGVVNFIISIMVSVYMISDHKDLFYHCKRLLYSVVPVKTANNLRTIARESANIFSGFIIGKAIDSLIIGIICFVAMLIFKFPYAMLISVIVGITNMIPYFGPYLGGVIGGVIILIVNPIQVLFFAILILVLQQFDGLFLGPKILGESTGLKPLWVIFAITVGGSLWGVIGMFLGVPVVAVIGYILNIIVDHFLNKKNVTVSPYDSPDEM